MKSNGAEVTIEKEPPFVLDSNNGFISRALLRQPTDVGQVPKTPPSKRMRRSTSEQREILPATQEIVNGK
jgi:hypothetical protein